MGRRSARRCALQILYQIDITNDIDSVEVEDFLTDKQLSSADLQFSGTLIKGVIQNLTEIDELIARFAKDWAIERLSYIDRNILRLAVYELNYLSDIPTKVSINEAIELAKQFSDRQAAKFINGVLGAVVTHSLRE